MGTCENTQTEAEMCMDTHRYTHTYRYNDQDTHIQKDSTRKTDICEDICPLIHTMYEQGRTQYGNHITCMDMYGHVGVCEDIYLSYIRSVNREEHSMNITLRV